MSCFEGVLSSVDIGLSVIFTGVDCVLDDGATRLLVEWSGDTGCKIRRVPILIQYSQDPSRVLCGRVF